MPDTEHLTRKGYEKELLRLQTELVYLQEWLVTEGRRLVVLFEGRDTAGKDGAIKRVATYLNPRTCRIAALPAPNERERTQSRARWVDYAEAKDRMFAHTDTDESPWHVVEADDKRTARLNLIAHLLSLVPYERLPPPDKIKLPERQHRHYKRPPREGERHVPARYAVD